MRSRSRTGKLYRRLDEVESQLRLLLVKEFGSELSGERPVFLNPHFRNSDYSEFERVHIDQLERLARQVESLRTKLGEPLGPVLTALTSFFDTWNDLGTKQNASDRLALVKQAISDLGERH